MTLVDHCGGYLYQHCVDHFPEGFLTDVEFELWCLFYDDKKAQG